MRNINKKLFVVLCITFVVPFIVFGIISYVNYVRLISDKIEQTNTDAIMRTERDTEDFLNELSVIASELGNREVIRSVLTKEDLSFQRTAQYLVTYEQVYGVLNNILIDNNMLNSVYLYAANGGFYYANYLSRVNEAYSPEQEEWLAAVREGSQDSMLLGITKDMQSIEQSYDVLPYVCSIPLGGEDGGSSRDVIVFNISAQMVGRIVQKYSPKSGGMLVTDGTGNEIYSNLPSGVTADKKAMSGIEGGINEFGGLSTDAYEGHICEISRLGWSILSITEKQSVSSATNSYPTFIMLFSCLFVVLLVFVTLFISRELFKPLKQFDRITREIACSPPDKKYSVEIRPNTGLLAEDFDRYTIAVAELVDELNASLDKRQEQERRILEAQINPHFIYNTLNSIKWQAIEDGNQKIADITTSIINLLKSTLKVGETYITIREELSQIKDYVEIQMFKHANDFSVSYDIDPGLLDCYTLKFILQPIVENAIFHGIRPNANDAMLRISIKRAESGICYTVEDNGAGMDEDEVAQLFVQRENPHFFSKGIGVYNVNERISKYFGEGYGIKIDSFPNKGTTVRIIIPVIKTGEADGERRQ